MDTKKKQTNTTIVNLEIEFKSSQVAEFSFTFISEQNE